MTQPVETTAQQESKPGEGDLSGLLFAGKEYGAIGRDST